MPEPAERTQTTVLALGPRRGISLKIYRHFLVVAVGQFGDTFEHQDFLLDTGAAPSIINARLVKRLGLETRTSTLSAAGKVVPTQTAIVPEVELGPVRADFLPVQVHDLSRLERELGIPLAGLIGLDVLSKASFRLDYENKKIEFGDLLHKGIPVPFDARTNLAVVTVTFGSRPARMLVDTGSGRVVLFGGNFEAIGWPELRNFSPLGTSLADQEMRVGEFFASDILLPGNTSGRTRLISYKVAKILLLTVCWVCALGFRAVSYDQTKRTLYLQK